ncbi:uncharacterized protein BBOV_IV000670 [Babesia bovis T2Bo]|uniref:Uncharacterized protein n=1 Tax=Babesia bovis TaxID=5865 RepID=A7AV39_BABBO|nr:uncharacterized protein BBOV_IV000670 [Babesia bovis T2Bo]EDO05665.1 hypothetical protein BBOV_IV000670 [Babesia bovis T2Bo]|eukprot:XP_001609233.1 hypothetical protein [Babesia bovis T2Bo]
MNAFGKVTKFVVAAFAVTACMTSYAVANEGETDPMAVDATVEENQPDATNEGNSPDATVDGNQPDATVDGNQPDATVDGNQPDASLYEYKHEVIVEPPYEGKIHVHLLSTIPSSKFLSREDRSINMEAVETRMKAIVERIVNYEPKKKWELDCKNIVACFKKGNDIKGTVEGPTSESDIRDIVESSTCDSDTKDAVEYSISDSDCKDIVACLKSGRPIELPEDVAQDLGNLESGPLPKTLIQQLAESLAHDLMRRKFGRMPHAPTIIFQNPRSIWQKKYKNIKNYVIEALKTPKVLEV